MYASLRASSPCLHGPLLVQPTTGIDSVKTVTDTYGGDDDNNGNIVDDSSDGDDDVDDEVNNGDVDPADNSMGEDDDVLMLNRDKDNTG